uniref:Myb/SANT-like domain-containing protein n=1 Tax=Lactuca sativa TaxID=4236 RepID=A0A9R1XWY8_LACSA|nr:hypothetical protein LSAT_V11C100045570 [Lactuca sativa]
MKRYWRLFDRLMRLESGIGWDRMNKSIVASSEWWDEKIKVNKDYGKFRGKFLEMYQTHYVALFRYFVAVEDRAKSPSKFQNLDDQNKEPLKEKEIGTMRMQMMMKNLFFRQAFRVIKGKKHNNNASTPSSSKGKFLMVSQFQERLETGMHALCDNPIFPKKHCKHSKAKKQRN